MGGLLGGGAAKGYVGPLSNYWGGAGLPPPLPTPMIGDSDNSKNQCSVPKSLV